MDVTTCLQALSDQYGKRARYASKQMNLGDTLCIQFPEDLTNLICVCYCIAFRDICNGLPTVFKSHLQPTVCSKT